MGITDIKVIAPDIYQQQAFFAYDKGNDVIIIAVRGSANLMNWLNNFDYDQVEYAHEDCVGCYVHSGFDTTYRAIAGEFNKTIV